jgi:polysaccharide chain length determinant protein (PEP-CTERM system associated)
MGDLLGQLSGFLRGIWKFRWPGLLVAWVVGAIGAAVVLWVPDKYEASARIYVDTQSILKPLMTGLAVQPNIEQQVVMLSRTLISRPNVEKLIRMADLDLGQKNKDQQEALVEQVTKSMVIRNTGRDNLYTLAYRDVSPDRAKRVVQSMVSIFVESSLGDSRKDSDSAKKFIDEQIKTYVAKLEEAESRLKEFKLRNIEVQTGDGKDMAGRIGEVSSQLSQARLELREAENAREAAKKQLDAERAALAAHNAKIASAEVPINIATPEIDSRIDGLRRNIDSLLQRFTEQHPDVVNSRRMIRELEEQKKKEIAELRKSAVSNPASLAAATPAMQEISRMLATSEVHVASLRARVGEYEARMKRAKELLKTAPQLEAEFTQLNRDYNIHKKNYDDLVARRESASLSGDLEGAAGVVDFRLIDPPRAENRPVAPNRLLLLPTALLAAVAAGIGTAFLASQMRAVFFDARSLRDATNLPLLGVVTLVPNQAMQIAERKDQRKFIAGFAGLVLAYAVGVAALAFFAARMG